MRCINSPVPGACRGLTLTVMLCIAVLILCNAKNSCKPDTSCAQAGCLSCRGMHIAMTTTRSVLRQQRCSACSMSVSGGCLPGLNRCDSVMAATAQLLTLWDCLQQRLQAVVNNLSQAGLTRTESGKPAVDVKRLKKKRYPHRLDHCIDGRRHRWLPHERTLMDPANHRNSCTNTQ